MNQGGGAPEASTRPSLEQRIQTAKAEIARRLRYVRQHHPEGPFTLAGLAERAGVSKRTLSHAESADGSNLTLETLLKVSYSLGISRDAYFLDEQVFHQVNEELETLRVLRTQRVEGVALRTASHGSPGPATRRRWTGCRGCSRRSSPPRRRRRTSYGTFRRRPGRRLRTTTVDDGDALAPERAGP
ncbi:helix-turn-helix domain-containing protein [Streptomyces syringium]|uniref:helix-turn-helix domain-containing protein n=1 Tax=Streptomyces syringium TaxID=76729 RepID=UPI003D944FEA